MTEEQGALYQEAVASVRAELQDRNAAAAAAPLPRAKGRAAKEAAALQDGGPGGDVGRMRAVERALGSTRLKALFTYLRKARAGRGPVAGLLHVAGDKWAALA